MRFTARRHAAMRIDDAVHNREPESSPLFACREERIEDPLARFGRNTRARIFDREHDETAPRAIRCSKSRFSCGKRDFAMLTVDRVGTHRFHSVAHKI
jgi:hypothetical protein